LDLLTRIGVYCIAHSARRAEAWSSIATNARIAKKIAAEQGRSFNCDLNPTALQSLLSEVIGQAW
jgi:hypothetical protein